MKKLVLSALAVTFASPVAAQSGAVTLSVKATGGWEMICHVATRSGDQLVQSLDGGRSALSSRDFSSISCDQTSAGRGPLVVSVSGPAVCPFKGTSNGACEQTFPSGRSGRIVVRPKRP